MCVFHHPAVETVEILARKIVSRNRWEYRRERVRSREAEYECENRELDGHFIDFHEQHGQGKWKRHEREPSQVRACDKADRKIQGTHIQRQSERPTTLPDPGLTECGRAKEGEAPVRGERSGGISQRLPWILNTKTQPGQYGVQIRRVDGRRNDDRPRPNRR